ncbi:MAG TPA: cell division protein ZapE [Legionellaceae bacterium]|nr:cell division protein ZapE [Legionellaceae bacterium]
MNLEEAYTASVQRGDIQDDAEQRRLLLPLQRIARRLATQQAWYRFLLPKQPLKGLYIVGPVGVGKTFMMDLFYQSLPEQYKIRLHFLQFMQQIDQKLRFLQGHSDPLQKIAADFSKQYHMLCLDEFMVNDVAHAMILAELLAALFARRVIVVATSNTCIDDLYLNGMNRKYFLPAIALLHAHCDELILHSSLDYRLGKPITLHAYIYPLNRDNQKLLEQQFYALSSDVKEGGEIVVQSRHIPMLRMSSNAIWFEFAILCGVPRSQLDYIELADKFPTIFVSNIPNLSQLPTVTAVVLFIQLVDILYDRGIRLVISAAVPLSDLYSSGPMQNEFVRTLSRLEEMQTDSYLSRHCPQYF